MANSEILPGQPITASKLNNITTGTTPPSQPYQVGALWGQASALSMATSTTVFTNLSSLLFGPPGSEYTITPGTRSFDSTNSYVWWPLTLNGPPIPSDKYVSGEFYLRMAPANLSVLRLYVWGSSSPNTSNRLFDGVVYPYNLNKTVNWLLLVKFRLSRSYSTSSGNRRQCILSVLFMVDDNFSASWTTTEMYSHVFFGNYTSSSSAMSFGVGTTTADNAANFYYARYLIGP